MQYIMSFKIDENVSKDEDKKLSWENLNMTIYHINKEKDELEGLTLKEQHEKISTFINKQLSSNNLSIFIGSGCSTGAVPLMRETMEKILEKEQVLKQVKLFLDSKEISEFDRYVRNKDNEIKNRNKIIMQIEGQNFITLNDYVEWLNNYYEGDKKLINEVIDKYYRNYTNIEELLNWLQNGLYYNPRNNDLEDAFNILKKDFIESIPKTNSEKYTTGTFEIYKNFYRHVFDKRNTLKSKVSIFTTNYDLFNEYALEANNIFYSTGFQNTIQKKFDINQFKYRIVDDTNKYKEKWQPISKEANLYKIHGSINWKSNNMGELEQKDYYSDDENNERVVIYPTMLKHKETSQAPYSELFREFSNCLQKKDTTLIIIGYGFPDEHINNIIAQNLKNQDFNLIIFGDKSEDNLKEFYEENKNYNLHIIGGEIKNNQKVHYFQYIVDEFLIYQNIDESEGDIEQNA
ncbi:SIR2 family protein [Staphylococcus pasteuri_A]|nr:SIR2 family protein [Staphylococcus pasteuri]MDO6573597.1 SIR2 family protein [Staphylococcus pasteuri_A]